MSSPERYRKGAHTVLDIQYHFVWKTKYGYRVLEKQIGQRLRNIIQEVCSKYGMPIKQGNIRVDHVHVLVSAPAYLSIAKIESFLNLRKRYWEQHLWARGYFCSTVGVVTEEIVKKYIEGQEDNDNFKIWDKDLSLN